MTDVIVLNKYRGKGYGKEVLNLLMGFAKSRGIKHLYDKTAIDNPAIKMFFDFGFKEVYRNEEFIMVKKIYNQFTL